MGRAISKDGTSIVFNKNGQGPAVILIDGAMCDRASGIMPKLSTFLEPYFTVYAYDRRGRGESGDMENYSIIREIEDIEAMIIDAGGVAFVYGISSGAVLGLRAAEALGNKIQKLALYEAPFSLEESDRAASEAYTRQLTKLLSAGERGDAIVLFMSRVGVPSQVISGMRQAPMWSGLEAIAPTLAYDSAIMGDGNIPKNDFNTIGVPTLVIYGEDSPQFMHAAAKGLVEAIPNAQILALKGQKHDVKPEIIAPALIEFFNK